MRLALLLVLVTLVRPLTAAAQPAAPAADDPLYSCKPRATHVEITMKPEVELRELLAWVVGFTCKRFILDPRIVSTGKKVTLIAPGKQSQVEAYQTFLVALSTMGLTVVPKGNILMIVEASFGKSQSVPIYRDKLPPDSEQVVRYMLRPEHVQPDTLVKALAPFKSDAGDTQVLGTFVLATDRGSNVRDMISIAKLVDVAGTSEAVFTIPVMHADATKLRDKISSVLALEASAGAPSKGEPAQASPGKLAVDERTNTLLVTGGAALFDRVSALVERLDISLDIEGGTSMHVYQLGNAVAEELATTLNNAIQAQTQPGEKKPAVPGATAAAGQLAGPAKIVFDKPTNKLIVMSSGRDFIAIRDIIRELDVPRRQVYIEAMVLEVQLGNGLNVGTASHGGKKVGDDSLLVGGIQMPNLKSFPDAEKGYQGLGAANGLITGILGKTLTGSASLFGMSIPSYAILFQAFADSSRTNILSSMPLIVVDNEQAKYKLGTNVPYSKGLQPTSQLASATLQTNIDRKDLLLELEIKPHISTDDSVLLEVKQGAEDLVSTDQVMGPTWSTRSIETRVLVRDQQTIVLGGLIQHREIHTQSKVPLLGDIPVLGHLFKYTTKNRKKTNLLIMLTPYIIKDNLDLDMIRDRKQREYDEFVGTFNALDGEKYMPRIDYTRKRGVVEEINRTIQDIEADAAARSSLRDPARVKAGLVETAPRRDVAPSPSQTEPTQTALQITPAQFIELPSLRK